MRGSLCFVGLVLFLITLTVGSALRHSARKQWKNSFQLNDEDSLGKYFYWMGGPHILKRPRHF